MIKASGKGSKQKKNTFISHFLCLFASSINSINFNQMQTFNVLNIPERGFHIWQAYFRSFIEPEVCLKVNKSNREKLIMAPFPFPTTFQSQKPTSVDIRQRPSSQSCLFKLAFIREFIKIRSKYIFFLDHETVAKKKLRHDFSLLIWVKRSMLTFKGRKKSLFSVSILRAASEFKSQIKLTPSPRHEMRPKLIWSCKWMVTSVKLLRRCDIEHRKEETHRNNFLSPPRGVKENLFKRISIQSISTSPAIFGCFIEVLIKTSGRNPIKCDSFLFSPHKDKWLRSMFRWVKLPYRMIMIARKIGLCEATE